MEAGETRRGQQLGEGALRLPCLQGDAIEQKLVSRHSEQKTAVANLGHG